MIVIGYMYVDDTQLYMDFDDIEENAGIATTLMYTDIKSWLSDYN